MPPASLCTVGSSAPANAPFSSKSATLHTNRAKTTIAKATRVHALESHRPLFARDGAGLVGAETVGGGQVGTGRVGAARVEAGDRSVMAEDETGGGVGSTRGATTVNGIGSTEARSRARRGRVGFALPRAGAAVLDSLR
jgi:hypothetical protein